MKRTVSETEHYQIKVDSAKNRLYLTLKGTWRAPSEIANYVANLRKAVRMLQPNFTLLANFSLLLPFPPRVWEEVHAPALQMLFQEGMGKSAQILPRNEDATELLEKYAAKSNTKLAAFGEEGIAELFLES